MLAGENDPRCPIRQVDNYLDALAARGGADGGGVHYEVSRFDAGHGSLVVDETIAHIGTEIGFAWRALGGRVSALPRPDGQEDAVAANVTSS